MPTSFSIRLRQHRHRLRRRAAVQPLGAGKIEIGFVQRQRFDHAASVRASWRGLACDCFGIFRQVGLDDDRVRAKLQRLEHRHRRSHAIGCARHSSRSKPRRACRRRRSPACRAVRDCRVSRWPHKTRRNPYARWTSVSSSSCARMRRLAARLAARGAVRASVKTIAAERAHSGSPGHLVLMPQPCRAAHAAGIAMHVLHDASLGLRGVKA